MCWPGYWGLRAAGWVCRTRAPCQKSLGSNPLLRIDPSHPPCPPSLPAAGSEGVKKEGFGGGGEAARRTPTKIPPSLGKGRGRGDGAYSQGAIRCGAAFPVGGPPRVGETNPPRRNGDSVPEWGFRRFAVRNGAFLERSAVRKSRSPRIPIRGRGRAFRECKFLRAAEVSTNFIWKMHHPNRSPAIRLHTGWCGPRSAPARGG